MPPAFSSALPSCSEERGSMVEVMAAMVVGVAPRVIEGDPPTWTSRTGFFFL